MAVAAAAALLLTSGLAATQGAAKVELRAWLNAPKGHAGSGVFIARLQGRTLAWSLAYRRVGSQAVAELRFRGRSRALPTRLCRQCPKKAHGKTVLTTAKARALLAGRASVNLHASRRGSIEGPVVHGSAPTLQILSPKPHEVLTLPTEIAYRVTDLAAGPRAARLQVHVAGIEARSVDLALAADAGTVTLPDQKDAYLTGHHDLSFQLATADLVPLPNHEARVVVRDLTIQGRRTPP